MGSTWNRGEEMKRERTGGKQLSGWEGMDEERDQKKGEGGGEK